MCVVLCFVLSLRPSGHAQPAEVGVATTLDPQKCRVLTSASGKFVECLCVSAVNPPTYAQSPALGVHNGDKIKSLVLILTTLLGSAVDFALCLWSRAVGNAQMANESAASVPGRPSLVCLISCRSTWAVCALFATPPKAT